MSVKLRIGAGIVLALALVVAVGIALLRGGGDAEPLGAPAGTEQTQSTPSASPSPSEGADDEDEPDASDEATAPECEGPDTLFNVEGVRQDSLLPDCGAKVVTRAEEKKSGLDLGCGGKYPVILYKTTTEDASTSICGTNASGEVFRLVTKPDGDEVLDLKGRYDPGSDAFIGEDGSTQYAVLAYDGSLVVTGPDGVSRTQESDGDWISLDNESDFD